MWRVFIAVLLALPVATAHARTLNADQGLGLNPGLSGPAVTFGPGTPVPMGYYQLCKADNPVCRISAGHELTDGGVVHLDDHLAAELLTINATVNQAIRPVADIVQYKAMDVWAVNPKAGDCEDYALSKKARLLSLGWPSSALLIALAYTRSGEEHAVLIVRTDRGDFVLDNLRSRIRRWTASLYHWKEIEAPDQEWVWYRFGAGTVRAEMTVAAADKPAPSSAVTRPIDTPAHSPAAAMFVSATTLAAPGDDMGLQVGLAVKATHGVLPPVLVSARADNPFSPNPNMLACAASGYGTAPTERVSTWFGSPMPRLTALAMSESDTVAAGTVTVAATSP